MQRLLTPAHRALLLSVLALTLAAGVGAGLFGGSLIGPVSAAADPTCMADPLGAAAPYDEFIAGDAHRGAESEGAVAYGANLTAASMTVGSRLTSGPSFPSLIVAGNTNASFNLQSGSAAVADSRATINFNGGGSRLSSDPIDFSSAFATISANSQAWAARPANGTAQVIAPGADGTPAMGGSSSLLLSGSDAKLDVFSVTAAQLAGSAAIFVQVPTGATALINVGGSANVTISGTLEFWNGSAYGQPDTFSEGAGATNQVTDTVWNLPAAAHVSLDTGDAFGGTIVAPAALVDAANIGHNDGAVIAKGFMSNFETHNYLLPASACLPTAPTIGPSPPANAELHISKSANVAAVQAGQDVTYTLTAANHGAGAAENVVVSDTLPATMTFVSASPGCEDAALTVTCTAATVAPGASTSFTIVARAEPVPASTSLTSTSDQLTVVKAEQYMTAQAGQTVATDLSCGSGMFATDASVEVVHVDQGTGTLEDVHVSDLQQLADGSYEAVLANASSGQAQAELFATCMSDATQQGFPLVVSDEQSQSQALAPGTQTVALRCGPGRTPVAPSFAVTSGQAVLLDSTPVSGDERDLSFNVASGGANVTSGIRCLENATAPHNGSTEQLGFSQVSAPVTVPAGQEISAQLACGDLQKGIVGGWSLAPGLDAMGNEPQPKIRLFWLDNPSAAAQTGSLSLLCVDEYLSRLTATADASAVLTNTASATTSSPQDAGAVTSASAAVTVSDSTAAPAITLDPAAHALIALSGAHALRLNGADAVRLPITLRRATSIRVALTLRGTLRDASLALRLRPGAELAHASVRAHRSTSVSVLIRLAPRLRRALRATEHRAVVLVVREGRRVARVALTIRNP